MSTIQSIVRNINTELAPQFEQRLRHYLNAQDKAWLIDQIVQLTMDAHHLPAASRDDHQEAAHASRAERMQRLCDIALHHDTLQHFLEKHRHYDRITLIRDGFLLETAPEKGTALIDENDRSPEGNALLLLAKDMLFGFLFGDAECNTRFERVQREMLTLALPKSKADALDFMKATTELSALGTWQDPGSVSNDVRAENILLEVEFGEVAGEWIGQGIVRALSLINNLEVNEQILYARMINIEQSTLIE